MLISQICFFVVFGLFHISAFQNLRKMFDQRKRVGLGRLFSLYPFTYSYLPKTCFHPIVGIKWDYLCIGFINNCDVTFCTPNAETFFISPWEWIAFLLFFFDSIRFSRALFWTLNYGCWLLAFGFWQLNQSRLIDFFLLEPWWGETNIG
jgi:hypothetical protein